MSHDKRRDKDFAGLGQTEARQLEETANALRAERHVPEDPAFWSALEQRIANEVAVTPVAGQHSPSDSRTTRPLGRLVGLLRRSWRRRLTSGALAVVAITALVLMVLSKDRPPESAPVPAPTQGLAERQPLGPDPRFERDTHLAIPDELWQDGFLAHRALAVSETLDVEAYDEAWDEEAESDPSDLASAAQWAATAFDWPAGDAPLDALAADFDWGLAELDAGELELLAELLDG